MIQSYRFLIASKAITDKYYWSQSLQELTLEIEVGVCKASEIKVDVTATRPERGWGWSHVARPYSH